jgi:hypothetical protein
MIHNFMLAAMLAMLLVPIAAHADDDAPASSPAPHAFFLNIKDGDTVSSPVNIKFGIVAMEVAPAGTNKPNTGHFHLLIDTELTANQQNSDPER